MYALFGANIAHIIINWKEEAVIFRRFKHGQDLKPLSKRYAKWGRAIRAAVLGFWFTSEVGYAIYEKIVKCEAWDNASDTQEGLHDFDKCYQAINEHGHFNNTLEDDARWWCKTETSYSAHIFGFLAGKYHQILKTFNYFNIQKIKVI